MSAPQFTVALEKDLVSEVERLRTLLERQSSCLMRIGADGTLLAVNAAALGLVGGKALAEVLGTSFLQLMPGDAAAVWAEFVARVTANGSASLECDISDLAGTARAVIVQGVALTDHPDGVPSLLVTARDVTTTKRLEESLQAAIDRLTRERQELEAALAELKMALNVAAASAAKAQAAIEQGSKA